MFRDLIININSVRIANFADLVKTSLIIIAVGISIPNTHNASYLRI